MKTLFILTLAALSTSSVYGVIAIASPSDDPANGWVAVGYSSGYSDYFGDQQTGNGGGESDIVGIGANAGFYYNYDSVDEELGFRVRLGGDDQPAGFNSALIIAFEIDGVEGLDFYLGFDFEAVGQGSDKNDIGFYQFDPGATNPSNTTSKLQGSSDYLLAYDAVDGVNYDWSVAGGAGGIDTSAPVDVDGGLQDDYFISFKVPYDELLAEMVTQGYTIDEDTAISLLLINSNNLETINNDYGGINGTDSGSTNPWSSAGLSGSAPAGAVPEPTTYTLIFGMAAFALVVNRRRR